MKFKKFTFIYFLFSVLAIGTIFMSFSGNPPNGRTGAPGEGLCTDCHAPSAALDGELTITGFPTFVAPGSTYEITVVVRNSNGNAQRNGFQAVVLDASDNNIGALTAGASQRTETANFRQYVEHAPAVDFANNEVEWTFEWTAPEGGQGEAATLYIGAIVADGSGGNSGDLFIQNSFSTTIDEALASDDLEATAKIGVFPNPAKEYFTLDLDGPANESVDIRLMTATGQLVYTQTDLSLSSRTEISVANLAGGIYFLQLDGETSSTVKRVVVMN